MIALRHRLSTTETPGGGLDWLARQLTRWRVAGMMLVVVVALLMVALT